MMIISARSFADDTNSTQMDEVQFLDELSQMDENERQERVRVLVGDFSSQMLALMTMMDKDENVEIILWAHVQKILDESTSSAPFVFIKAFWLNLMHESSAVGKDRTNPLQIQTDQIVQELMQTEKGERQIKIESLINNLTRQIHLFVSILEQDPSLETVIKSP